MIKQIFRDFWQGSKFIDFAAIALAAFMIGTLWFFIEDKTVWVWASLGWFWFAFAIFMTCIYKTEIDRAYELTEKAVSSLEKVTEQQVKATLLREIENPDNSQRLLH